VNRVPADMRIVIIQNTSAPEDKDNIGIGESLSRLSPRVLSAVFGVPAETFSSFEKIDNAIVILRSPESTLAAVVRPSPAAQQRHRVPTRHRPRLRQRSESAAHVRDAVTGRWPQHLRS